MRKTKFALLALVASPAVFAATGESVESVSAFRFSVSDHLIFSNSSPAGEDKRTNLFLHEDTVRAEYGNASLGIHFTNRYTFDGDLSQNKPFNLEKKFGLIEWENVELKLGDHYQEIGRGIALSLYKDPVLGVDNTLEGGAVRFHPQVVDASLFAGRVNSLTAPVAINPLRFTTDENQVWMAGTQTRVSLGSEAKVGGHYLVAMKRPSNSQTFAQRWDNFGVMAEKQNIVDGLDAYVETNTLTNLKFDGSADRPMAHASFAAVTWSPAPWKVKLEGKDYRNYLWVFQRPPSLEEDIITEINVQNISATRLYGEYRDPASRTTFHASYLVGDDRIENTTINHGVIGTKFRGPSRSEYEFRTGYRWLTNVSNMVHVAAKAKVATFKSQNIDVEFRKQLENVRLDKPTQARNERNIFSATYTLNEKFNVSLGYEYVPFNDFETGKNFYNAGGFYKDGPLTARAFVGKTSGGPVCSGGVCRQIPPYTGAMLETTYVF